MNQPVARIVLEKGDVLVFCHPGKMTPEAHINFRKTCADLFPGQKAIVLTEGMTVRKDRANAST